MTTFPQNYLQGAGMSVLDVINLAHCAAMRAHGTAGDPGRRFYREYKSALMWSAVAASYNLTTSYS